MLIKQNMENANIVYPADYIPLGKCRKAHNSLNLVIHSEVPYVIETSGNL